MKILLPTLSFLLLSVPAFADTRDSNKDKTSMEQGRSPSAPQKQEEEHAEAHSQPGVPNAGGTAPRDAKKSKSKAKAAKKESSSSAGSSGQASLDDKQELAFRKYDLDGDGDISKAEAAGTDLINAFDRFDRNKDGKLNRAEYARAIAPKRQASQ